VKNRYKSTSRLAKLETALERRSPPPENSLYHRVLLEAEQELSPDELRLYKSADAACSESRFHTLEEHVALMKYWELRDVVAQRYGTRYSWLFHDHIDALRQSRPPYKLNRAAEDVDIRKILNWGRDNDRHVRKLLRAQEELQSSTSESVTANPSWG
jgi:hypothetical protein